MDRDILSDLQEHSANCFYHLQQVMQCCREISILTTFEQGKDVDFDSNDYLPILHMLSDSVTKIDLNVTYKLKHTA